MPKGYDDEADEWLNDDVLGFNRENVRDKDMEAAWEEIGYLNPHAGIYYKKVDPLRDIFDYDYIDRNLNVYSGVGKRNMQGTAAMASLDSQHPQSQERAMRYRGTARSRGRQSDANIRLHHTKKK